MKECKDMTDEKSTKDPKAETTSAKDPATDEKSTSAKAKADKPKPKAGKEKKSTPQKPTLTQKEIDALIVENAEEPGRLSFTCGRIREFQETHQ
jgi:hypothetical protein